MMLRSQSLHFNKLTMHERAVIVRKSMQEEKVGSHKGYSLLKKTRNLFSTVKMHDDIGRKGSATYTEIRDRTDSKDSKP